MAVVKTGLDWEGKDCEFYMDDNLLKNLYKVKEVVCNKDFDFVCVITGLPGVGKSNFAIDIAKTLDPNFNEKKIYFEGEEWKEGTLNHERNSAIILDESFKDFNSRRGGSEEFMDIINHLQIIRQKNHFLIFVLPSFFDLHKSLAIYRSSFLFECYGQEFGDRGTFKAFDRYSKKLLYLKGKQWLDEEAVKPNFIGRFVTQKVFPKDLYEKMKAAHLERNALNIKNNKQSKIMTERNRLVAYLKLVLKMKNLEIQNIAGISENTIFNAVNAVKEEIKLEWGSLGKETKEQNKT